jgi:hypothetical protein
MYHNCHSVSECSQDDLTSHPKLIDPHHVETEAENARSKKVKDKSE